MKRKDKRQGSGGIREVNVDDLVNSLKSGPLAQTPPKKGINPAIRISEPSGASATSTLLSQRQPGESQAANNAATRLESDTRQSLGNSAIPNVSPDHGSKAGKLRHRLQMKLAARQDNAVPRDAAPSESGESVDAKREKRRKNYVDRNSSVASGLSPPKRGYSWKDLSCVALVVLLVVGAGFMRFYEEMIGSTSHMRLESDADADFYEILGVTHAATLRDIKRAYRNKVVEVHPDQHPDCAECGVKFIAVTKAYETLVDPDQRSVYDTTRGSYEPILSDYSISLTSFNFHSLVSASNALWIIQVYDDIDPYSKYFAQHWDSVAGDSWPGGLKFGRVNARRDSAVLGLLPMRARTYPTVMMFSRDTMPTIFSLADTSARAFRKWINEETPSHVGETSSRNVYSLSIHGTGTKLPLAVKLLSLVHARVFDVDWVPKSRKLEISLTDKRSGALLFSHIAYTDVDSLYAAIDSMKRRIAIPVDHHNIRDLCAFSVSETSGVDGVDVSGILCVSALSADAVLASPSVQNEYVIQSVVFPPKLNFGKSTAIDIHGSRVATFTTSADDEIYIDDLRFASIDMNEYLRANFPMSYWETVKEHSVLLTVAGMAAAASVVLTKIGPVQITVAVLGLSFVVGVLNALPPNLLQTAVKFLAQKVR